MPDLPWFQAAQVLDAPYARVGISTTLAASATIANNAAVALGFDVETEDAYNMHDNATANTRLTCVKAGIYLAFAEVEYDSASVAGKRLVWLTRNGEQSGFASRAAVTVGASPAGNTQLNVSALTRLAVGDYLEVVALQTSGGALKVGGNASVFGAVWLRP